VLAIVQNGRSDLKGSVIRKEIKMKMNRHRNYSRELNFLSTKISLFFSFAE
jgi:hypothetical protein